MANTYTLIEKAIVGSGGTAYIQFNSIPATYKDLVIKMSLRQDASSDGYQLGVRFNSSTSGYSRTGFYGNGSVSDTAGGSSETFARFGFNQSSTFTASTFGSYEMYVSNYASSSTYKLFLTDSVTESNSGSFYAQGIWTGLWGNNSAITSILLQDLSGSTNFVENSVAYLYGIKNS